MNISTTIFPGLKHALVAGWLLDFWRGTTHAGTLADAPLNLKSGVPPNVMFALSVENRPRTPLPTRMQTRMPQATPTWATSPRQMLFLRHVK